MVGFVGVSGGSGGLCVGGVFVRVKHSCRYMSYENSLPIGNLFHRTKKRRLFGRKYLPEYLKELGNLLQRKVGVSELVSIVDTDIVLNQTEYLRGYLYYKEVLSFSNKPRLKIY